MAKTYVVAPNFSIPPGPKIEGSVEGSPPSPVSHEGKLQLGDIITNPFGPKPIAINRYDRTPIKKKYIEELDRKGGVQHTGESLWKGRLGVWGSLLASLGIGPALDVSIHAQMRSKDVLTIETLDTYELDVRDEYVKEVLQSKSIDAYIKTFSRVGAQQVVPLYLVCGLKIARGASSEFSDLLEAGADAGAPGNTNARLVELLRQRHRGVSFKTSTDFVLAFQLMHVKYNVQTKEAETEISTKKATMADGGVVSADKLVIYEGVDDDISKAKNGSQEVIEAKDDGLGELVLIPDIE